MRLDEALVRAAVRSSAWFARLLRPGARLILLAASLFAAGALMKEAEFPDAEIWDSGSAALYALLACALVTYLGYALVTLGYERSLQARDDEAKLYRACRDVAALVERTTRLERDSVGVHVWTVKGLHGMQRLERRATFIPGDRPPTAIVWRKGKGAIGRCWERDEWVLAPLEEIQALAPTEDAFGELDPEMTFSFTWSEFANTAHYKAILAWPLHGGPEAAPRFVGALSIDVQQNGAADELKRFRRDRWSAFSHHLALCEAVLRGK